MMKTHTNENCVEHDYALCAMVKIAQVGDFNVHANLASKMVPCRHHKGELVQCDKMCLPDS